MEYCLTFNALEMAVKTEKSSANIDVIDWYFRLGLTRAISCQDIADTKRAHLRLAYTLFETISDGCLTISWRKACYQCAISLLPLLKEILPTAEFYAKKQNLLTAKLAFLNDGSLPTPAGFTVGRF